MDFMLNGPRLQMGIVDGLEDLPTNLDDSFSFNPTANHGQSYNSIYNTYPRFNSDVFLQTQANGKQRFVHVPWPSSNTSGTVYSIKRRYALKTESEWYIIVTVYGGSFLNTVHYCKVGQYPVENSITAKALTVKLPRSIWKKYSNSTANPDTYTRRNGYIYYGNSSLFRHCLMDYTGSAEGYSATGDGYWTKSCTDDEITYKFEFPAGNYAMRSNANYWFDVLPLDIQGKKFAGSADCVLANPTENGYVAKVYSPDKGCMCLKSYVNGEIPILNE